MTDDGDPLSFLAELRDYAVFMLDVDGVIRTWNEGARLLKGYEATEIIGQHIERFYTLEDRADGRPQRLLHTAVRDGRVRDEGWRVRKDGSLFWADIVITAIHEEGGALRGFVKVTRDLTERRAADERLKQSEERLRLLVESVKDYAIFMLDEDGIITTWNSGAELIKGYAPEEIIGRHFSIFYPPEDLELGKPARELRTAIAEGRYEEEGWRLRKSGERFFAHVVLTAVHDEGGTLRGFAKVTRDLTERRRLEEEAREAERAAIAERTRAHEAHKNVKTRDEFISVAAHELRTPLTSLKLKVQGVEQALGKGGEELCEDPSRAPRLAKRLTGAIRQIERLSELVERLLDVTRIVQGKLVLRVEESDLAALVGHVVDDFLEPAQQAGSELRLQSPEPIVGAWDAARLEQVVVNLISNAIRYGGAKPVEVRIERSGGRARLIVTDHGVGISHGDIERIFGRFERASPVRHYGGLGLGLYISRNIVESHGGSIEVTSAPGEGSTFVVDLPIRDA